MLTGKLLLISTLVLTTVVGLCQPALQGFATIRTYLEGNELAYPYIELNSDQHIVFEFDEFGSDSKFYSYKLVHCNSNWEASNLSLEEYQSGFEFNDIADYSFSVNTKIPYVHYKLVLPNSDVGFLVSGHYLILVYDSNQKNDPIITGKFTIYEPLWNIRAEVMRPLGAVNMNSSQEVRFKINHEDTYINDPFSEVSVKVLQNNRPDAVFKNLKPVFVRQNELVYGNPGDVVFDGLNEFRMFDTRDIHLLGHNMNAIQYTGGEYHFQLKLDERRESKSYFTQDDLNGKNMVYVNNASEHYRFADYVWVYFNLDAPEPFIDGSVYVTGSFSNWQLNTNFKLQYNADARQYQTTLLLKQGYYNYMYCFKDSYGGPNSIAKLEGSHYTTENDYLIVVGYKPFGSRYERVMGYTVINSKFK